MPRLGLGAIAPAAGAALLLTLADVAVQGELSPGRLATRLGFVVAVLAGSWLARRWTKMAAGLGVVAVVAYALSRSTLAAWLALGAIWALLPAAESALVASRHRVIRLALRAGLAVIGAVVPLAIDQLESRFADEEFFVALTGLLLAVACFLLLTAAAALEERRSAANSQRRSVALAAAVLLLLSLAVATIHGYHASFYTPDPPQAPGISAESPFRCGRVSPAGGTPDGRDVWEKLVARVEAEPVKTPAELGFLALARGDMAHAQAFRAALLTEVRAGAYTSPAGSVKSVQQEAAWRIYFAVQVRQAFPDLYTPAEWAEIQDWAAAVNRRALQPGWVDWLYAFAFALPVQGPYANQEIGAGLLSVLNWSGLVPAALQAENAQFLADGAFGWAARFRNTDDAYLYQTVWLASVYLQSLVGTEPAADPAWLRNRRLAFEWLLVQARPDGTAPPYNHPVRPELAHTAYLGAAILGDPRYVWLASQAVAQLEASGQPLPAIPGIETPLALHGQSPDTGSCLIYGDSGLPTRTGPLAPDKVVMRDGWAADATWLALNLRFTGWHRYKATNAIIGLYEGGEVIVEQGPDQPYAWLPAGRSLPRDKRLDRQDLNGILVPRRGLSQALWILVGLGGRWAQDPPPYAHVRRFETLGGLDMSQTEIADWRGWDQARTVYFFPGGPVLIVDEAGARLAGGQAAVAWHVAGAGDWTGDELRLAEGRGRFLLAWPAGQAGVVEAEPVVLPDSGPGWDLLYRALDRGRLDLATLYLGPAWADAHADLQSVPGEGGTGWLLNMAGQTGRQTLLHNPAAGTAAAGGLATDGLAVSLRQPADGPAQICYVGGSEVRVALERQPAGIVGEGVGWTWQAGTLVLRPASVDGAGCIQVQE